MVDFATASSSCEHRKLTPAPSTDFDRHGRFGFGVNGHFRAINKNSYIFYGIFLLAIKSLPLHFERSITKARKEKNKSHHETQSKMNATLNERGTLATRPGQGIGRAIGQALAAQGARVVVNGGRFVVP